MALADIDFEGTGNQGGNTQPVDDASKDKNATNSNGDVTNLGSNDVTDITNQNVDDTSNKDDKKDDKDANNPSTGELVAGDSIDYDGVIYTVAENGDLVDKDGKVFKEAKDVQDWLKSVDVDDSTEEAITISSVQDALGVTITDEDGKPVEFTNNAEGVKSYVDSVIALKSNELQQAAVNRLYQDNPLLKQFQDYVQLTGSPRGFGEIPDRSGIQLDKDNDAQLVAVIKMAANEFGNKSLNDNYINYLKDSGNLYAEAKNQLNALVEKDKAYRQQIETKAQEQREAEAKSTAEYWNKVNNIVNSRQIGKYRIPESFTKEVNGTKVVCTPADFYKYISDARENEDGTRQTGYQRDLANLTDDEYLNREILDAWLMFTGGTYKDLVDMAIKEEQVRQLRVRSKEVRSNKTVKVIKNPSTKSSIDDIIL